MMLPGMIGGDGNYAGAEQKGSEPGCQGFGKPENAEDTKVGSGGNAELPQADNAAGKTANEEGLVTRSLISLDYDRPRKALIH